MTAFPMLMTTEQPRPFPGLLAAFILVGAAFFLFAFKDIDPYLGTIICGTGGTIAVFSAILVKYRGRLHFNAEIAFLMAMSLQYLLGPALSRIISHAFTDYGYSFGAERALIKEADGYPGAMLIVVLFAAAFLLTSAAIPLKRSPRLGDGRLAVGFTRRSYIIF